MPWLVAVADPRRVGDFFSGTGYAPAGGHVTEEKEVKEKAKKEADANAKAEKDAKAKEKKEADAKKKEG